ncbi:MAG: YihA family ribosome biogenesis GTP-binding protein [Clostridia bacterium]|nr:YihA family ribosome biogenesis GTP-binding protein [Clostridia bacterium]
MSVYNFQNARLTCTAGFLEQCPVDDIPEVVLAGRSNVGKSSLINALTNSRNLARVSQSPGKTRLVLYFQVDRAFYLTDLPGYGYARASQAEQEKFNQLADRYLTSGRPIALVLLLVDIRLGPTAQDQQLMEWLEHEGIEYLLVLSKADKFSKAQISKKIQEYTEAGLLPQHVPFVPISSSKRDGIKQLQELITRYLHTV